MQKESLSETELKDIQVCARRKDGIREWRRFHLHHKNALICVNSLFFLNFYTTS